MKLVTFFPLWALKNRKDSMVLALAGADPVAEMAKIGAKTSLYLGSPVAPFTLFLGSGFPYK